MYASQSQDGNTDLICPTNQISTSNPTCVTILADTCGMEDR